MRKPHSISSKLLTVLFILLALSTSIFVVQRARRAQGVESSISYTIYEGVLASGWHAQSSASRINLTNTSLAYSGSKSISFTPTGKGARLYLYTNIAIDTTLYSFFHFAVQASQAGQSYNVILYNGINNPLSTVRLAHYGGDPAPRSWKVYNIPLSDLKASATPIMGIAIQSRTRKHGTLYLDSISFTRLVSSPTSTSISQVISPSLQSSTPLPTIGTTTVTTTAHFYTLPPGSQLPSDAACAARVRQSAWEPRPDNSAANHTNVYAQGYRITNNDELKSYGYENRVTGNFTGTTDEIIQWAACKWGFDEDAVRAQAVQESYWHQSELGDCRGATVPQTHGCQSVGILQVKGADLPPTHPGTWPYAYESTAFNLDYTLAIRRGCFEGKATWLGNGYRAGDMWGCIGRWYSGAWYDAGAQEYINQVKNHLANKDWLRPGF
jgi:hypothetical protein